MEYTITTMEYKPIVNDKEYIGYTFIDKYGCCIIIVYGENKRDLMINYLDGKS